MTFYLQNDRNGRVILADYVVLGGSVNQEIEANSWYEARLQVQEFSYNRVDGYGWYMPESRDETPIE